MKHRKRFAQGPDGSSMALLVKIVGCFGVLEYWSAGVLVKAKALIST
jgi:hypothetical protein